MGVPFYHVVQETYNPPEDSLFFNFQPLSTDLSWAEIKAEYRNQYIPLSSDNDTFQYSSDTNVPPPFVNITAEVIQNFAPNINCSKEECEKWWSNSTIVRTDLEDKNIFIEERNWLFLLLILLVVAGGLGNVLVCLAICLERRLQNVTNYFLLSLAVADLLVCVAVMPFGILDGFLGYWPFDWHICSIWVSCDVLSCSSSIMHMCFISLGRYLGIRNPLKTRASSKKMVMMKIVLVWLVSMVITSPITVLAMIDATNIEPSPGICAINNRFFFVFGSMFAFYVPMLIMVVTYVLTVRLLKRKAKFLAEKPSRRVPFIRRVRRPSPESPDTSTNNGHVRTTTYCNRCRKEVDTTELLDLNLSDSTRSSSNSSLSRSRSIKKSRHRHHHRHSFQQQQQQQHQQQHQRPHHQQLVPGMVRTLGTSQVMNEQKATKVLGIVFFCFVICWTPFFLLNILFALKKPDDFPSYLATTFLWLGYVSSTINPIIYTVFNKTFKRAFWKLLTCQCSFSRPISLHSTNDLASWAFRSTNNYGTKPGSPPDPYQESMC